MNGRLKLAVVVTVMGAAAWLGLGWEVTSIDHETRYVVFIKSHPSTTLLFRSYMGCDECDAQAYTALSVERQGEFAEFCRAKYGFDDPRICNAIYAEQRKLKIERLTTRQAGKPGKDREHEGRD